MPEIKGRRGPKPSAKGAGIKTKVPSYPLMSYLAAEAQNRAETPPELAKQLGIGYVYLTQLLNGKKDTARLGRDVLISAAAYLDVPVAQAYLWAGALRPTDFVHEGKYKAVLGDVYEVMARHPQWGGFMPSKKDWNATPEKSRLLIVLFFQESTKIDLIDNTVVEKSA